ncbi:MAG TPA: hypothetical protein VKX25_11810 [Bryobacteraceae bacterium]|jgi:outer membrane biosynthesis protein TonB|nr:hypothetical protein [Bryobacteraceae bacterium]
MKARDSATGYAFWISPDGTSKVVYSLGTFGEIDAVVSDGYRRVPRGGIETGGVLFGTREDHTIRIEAMRQIECQHALGPSFILSEADRGALREQLRAAADDPELAGLIPVGWFIGHTRSSLELSEREAEWFNEFFPEAGAVTVLVKPERFQPTRFVFLPRGANGEVPRTQAGEPVILPLSTQAGAPAEDAAPAITAPQPVEPAPPKTPEPQIAEKKPAEPARAEPEIAEITPAEAQVRPPSPAPSSQVTRVRTPRPQPAAPSERAVPPVAPPPRTAPPPPPVYAKEPSDGTNPSLEYPYARLARTSAHEHRAGGFGGFGIQSIAVLVLAAVLGCLAGYWAYLQLPSPMIPVSVREQNGQVIVEWPATQTAGVDYAALQINDGQWLALSNEQKDEGRAVITPPAGDLKIDLVAKHWLRDSRGIVKYIRTPRSTQ